MSRDPAITSARPALDGQHNKWLNDTGVALWLKITADMETKKPGYLQKDFLGWEADCILNWCRVLTNERKAGMTDEEINRKYWI